MPPAAAPAAAPAQQAQQAQRPQPAPAAEAPAQRGAPRVTQIGLSSLQGLAGGGPSAALRVTPVGPDPRQQLQGARAGGASLGGASLSGASLGGASSGATAALRSRAHAAAAHSGAAAGGKPEPPAEDAAATAAAAAPAMRAGGSAGPPAPAANAAAPRPEPGSSPGAAAPPGAGARGAAHAAAAAAGEGAAAPRPGGAAAPPSKPANVAAAASGAQGAAASARLTSGLERPARARAGISARVRVGGAGAGGERASATQAAADRAHNAAVLAGAAGDEAYARRVAEEQAAQARQLLVHAWLRGRVGCDAHHADVHSRLEVARARNLCHRMAASCSSDAAWPPAHEAGQHAMMLARCAGSCSLAQAACRGLPGRERVMAAAGQQHMHWVNTVQTGFHCSTLRVGVWQAAGGRGRGRKRKGTVVQRLARKLLSGRARDAATGELLAAEADAQNALHANRWEER